MTEDSEYCSLKIVSHREGKAEIERLLADSRFKVSLRNQAFLRYLAEERFEGRSGGVKAYAIAVDVFGRPATFDQNIDPIVRIEAVRLRTALEQYYDALGGESPIKIELPRGRYCVEFQRNAAYEPSFELAEVMELRSRIPVAVPTTGRNLEFYTLVFAALVVIALGILLMIHVTLQSGG
jgi:hypothetical protein